MKKESFYLLSFLLIIPLFFFSSCNDDEDEPILAPLLESVTFSSEETVKTFTLQSNVGWVISSDDTWCSVSPEYGSGTQEITITLKSKNEDTSNNRTATLTIKSGQTVSKIIQITQSAAPKENGGDEDGDGEEEEENTATVNEIEINTTSNPENDRTGFKVWCFFSFEKGEVIGYANASSTEEDEKWHNDLNWDIAFSRVHVKTNSGSSGTGQGGAIEIGSEEDNKEKIFTELIEAPTGEYIEDIYGRGLMFNMPPEMSREYSYNPTVNAYCELNFSTMQAATTPKVFALRTADGKYVKIYLKENNNGIITMQYVYQPDGSTNLATEEK